MAVVAYRERLGRALATGDVITATRDEQNQNQCEQQSSPRHRGIIDSFGRGDSELLLVWRAEPAHRGVRDADPPRGTHRTDDEVVLVRR